MISRSLHPEIETALHTFQVGNNHYVNAALVAFAKDKLDAIETVCGNFLFDETIVRKIQIAYINELNIQINTNNLRTSYALRNVSAWHIGFQSHGLKAVNRNGAEIDPQSLIDYIEDQEQN